MKAELRSAQTTRYLVSLACRRISFDHPSLFQRVGILVFGLYGVQVALGAIIHWLKPKSWTKGGTRPIQNYIHGILGVLIIGLALYQARTGYKTEWPRATGRSAPNGVKIVWYIWAVVSLSMGTKGNSLGTHQSIRLQLLPVSYFAGLALLPRQFKQEKRSARLPNPSREGLVN
jgi:Eukaryotic cytochrome b561